MRVWNLLHIVSRKGGWFWESNFFEENAQTFKKYYFNAIWKNTFFYQICTPWKCHRFFLWFGEYQLIRRFISDILFESQTTSQCQSDTEVQTRKKLRIKRRKKNSIVLNIFFCFGCFEIWERANPAIVVTHLKDESGRSLLLKFLRAECNQLVCYSMLVTYWFSLQFL